MIKARFHADADDYRPVEWPPPGPYWCTGQASGYSILVAYAKSKSELLRYWPEASNIDAIEVDGYKFSDRFPEPKWWKAIQRHTEEEVST